MVEYKSFPLNVQQIDRYSTFRHFSQTQEIRAKLETKVVWTAIIMMQFNLGKKISETPS